MKVRFTIFFMLLFLNMRAQSFDSDKTSLVNYVKRLYSSSAFEGAKTIDSEDNKYNVVAITISNNSQNSIDKNNALVLSKAQESAQSGFAEPCIKFEMISLIENSDKNKLTYLFLCEKLSDFVKKSLKKKPFDGSKIISAPNNKFLISVITLENSKYASTILRDKVSLMKSKQQINAMLNGSTISSELIIRTDNNDTSTEVKNTEIITEQAIGFVDGIELLTSYETLENKSTYIYYKTLLK